MTIEIFRNFGLVFILNYFLGSINFAILISKVFFNKEIRNYGSKNAGTTNVLRTFGKKFALLTFAGDFLKGFLGVLISGYIISNYYLKIDVKMSALLAVVLGHIFPIYYKFKGGKGVATIAGGILSLNFKIFLIVFLVFAVFIVLTKMVSLSAVVAVIVFAIVNPIFWFSNLKFHLNLWFFILFKSTFIAFIIIFKHISNIKRILKNEEPKIGR